MPLYPLGSRVLHIKTGGEYRIEETPERCRIEASGEPAYAYRGQDGRLWVRAQALMEDGRFRALADEPARVGGALPSLFRCKAWADEELHAAVAGLAGKPEALHAALRILNHIYVVDRIFVGHLSGQAHGYAATNTPETPTLAELAQAARETDRWYQDYAAGLSREALAETLAFTFTDGGQGAMSREEMLLHVITHGGYHRGAVGRILVDNGIAPPRDIYTRFLHDSEPARRA